MKPTRRTSSSPEPGQRAMTVRDAEQRIRALRHRAGLLRDILLELDWRYGALVEEKEPIHLGDDMWERVDPDALAQLRGELITLASSTRAELAALRESHVCLAFPEGG